MLFVSIGVKHICKIFTWLSDCVNIEKGVKPIIHDTSLISAGTHLLQFTALRFGLFEHFYTFLYLFSQPVSSVSYEGGHDNW